MQSIVESAPKPKRGNPYRDANGRLTSKDKAVYDIRANPNHDKKGRFAKRPSTATHLGGEHDRTADVIVHMRDANADNGFYTPGEHDFSDPVDHQLAAISKMRGFDKHPTKGDIDSVIANGGTEIHRGLIDGKGKTAGQLESEFKTGPYEPGTGNYGNGFYFSTSPGIAKMYADAPIARAGYDAKSVSGGKTLRAALKPEAKIVHLDDLKAEKQEWFKQNKDNVDWDVISKNFIADEGKIHPAMLDLTNDPGHFATMMGYDAIRVPLKNRSTDKANAARIKRRIGSDDLGDEIVVLNRGMLVVE